MPQSDEALMERFRNGDRGSFELLVERYQKPIVNYLYRLSGDFAWAEDLAQEGFLVVYKKADLFQVKARFKPWFYKIVTNIYYYQLRKRRHFLYRSLAGAPNSPDKDVTEVGALIADPIKSPAQELEEKELQSQIRRLIDSLPYKQKAAIIMHIFEGFAYKEIASVMKCSVGTVRSRIHYGLQKIKSKVAKLDM